MRAALDDADARGIVHVPRDTHDGVAGERERERETDRRRQGLMAQSTDWGCHYFCDSESYRSSKKTLVCFIPKPVNLTHSPFIRLL